jgi:lipoate-protein ligase B
MINSELRTRITEPVQWYCVELPLMDYSAVWHLQTGLVEARKKRIIEHDIVLLLEHPAVFTLGRSGGKENLKVSESFLKRSGTQMVHVERGGSITYHGPGQLVGYPIVDLNRFRLKVVDYVESLEEVMIRTAAKWGIIAERNPTNRGVWVGGNKLGSIGVAVRRGISFHGFALNVSVALEPFCWINPCGLKNIGMTSFEKELTHPVSIRHVRQTVKRSMQNVFDVKFVSTTLSQLEDWLTTLDDKVEVSV